MKIALTITLVLTFTFSVAQVTWVGGDGNWNAASNWDPKRVPTLTDSVVIDSPLGATVEITNLDPKIKALYIGMFNELIVHTGHTLAVAGAGKAGINLLGGTLTVHGAVGVSNSGGTGISIFNPGVLVNNGLVTVNQSQGDGIALGGGLSNQGILRLEDNTGNGITFNRTASLSENGQLILNRNNKGISVRSGSVTNKGNISMDGNMTGLEIRNNVFMQSNDDAIINIRNSVSRGMFVAGEFRNRGYLNIDGAGQVGIEVDQQGEMTSNNDSIIIHHITGIGIQNDNDFINSTYLEIFDCTSAAISSSGMGAFFDNNDHIYIDQCRDGILLWSGGKFDNRSNGDIVIQNCTNIGIDLDGVFSTFDNSSDLLISQCDMYGIKVTDGSTFNGNNSSTTEVNNVVNGCKIFSAGFNIFERALFKIDAITGSTIFDGNRMTVFGEIDFGY